MRHSDSQSNKEYTSTLLVRSVVTQEDSKCHSGLVQKNVTTTDHHSTPTDIVHRIVVVVIQTELVRGSRYRVPSFP